MCVNLNINFHPYSIHSVRLKCHATFFTVTDLIDARGVHCVVRNFCGSLFLRIGDFLCFAGVNFCD